jgi:hypothetical protein
LPIILNNTKLQKLPLGIQTFEKLRKEGFLYIDKTKYYKTLIEHGQFVFIARPRRFGKSLMLSTMKSIFLGDKALFKGLWIEEQVVWKKHPVIMLDFNSMDYNQFSLEIELEKQVVANAARYQIKLKAEGAKAKFIELLQALSTESTKVAILIDEYDKPIVDNLDDPKKDINIKTLKSFYGALKSNDADIHFCMVTGVSKFGKVSIFSDLNNLQDISLSPLYANMLGVTQEELEKAFKPHLENILTQHQDTREALLSQIKKWYNGYSWNGKDTIYCPFSVLNYFSPNNPYGTFRNFWFDTGTPTFLTNLIKEQNVIPDDLEWQRSNFSVIQSPPTDNVDIISLLFQTGYLTIKEIANEFGEERYYLGYPNHEVRQSFVTYLLAAYMEKPASSVSSIVIQKLQNAIVRHDWSTLVSILNELLSTVSHHILKPNEAWFHSIVHMALVLTGMQVISEYSTSQGRIDDVLINGEEVYIFEFKTDKTAELAFDQIKSKQYILPFALHDKSVWAIGVNFDSKTKSIESFKGELIIK